MPNSAPETVPNEVLNSQPMICFDPDPSLRWLFCLTHPDDEISICAWIHRLTHIGAEVSMCWTHSTPEREGEGRAVANLLRVPQSRLTFLTGRDGNLCEQMGELHTQLADLVDRLKPDRIVCGAFEQGHLDHDATNFMVNRVFEGPVLEVPFYHTYLTRLQRMNRFANPHGQQILHLSADEQRFKKTVARQYPSQNIWSVLLWYEVWQSTQLRPAQLAKSERMRLQTHTDFRIPNLPARLRSQVELSKPWHRWLRAVDRFEAKPG